MGWAIFWTIVVYGVTNSGWAAFFAFVLSLTLQDISNRNNIIVNQQRKLNDYEDELAALRNNRPATRKWDPDDPIDY